MHPASPGDKSPASPSGITPTPLDAFTALAAWAEIKAEGRLDSEDLPDIRKDLDAARAALDALDAEVRALAEVAPGSPRWTRTAEALRDAADAEGFDFDAYGDDALDGYSGRGMFGREVPALTLDEHDEAAVVAHAFRKATGVRASVDSLGLGFVVYPGRLVD
jgi:hypothetical protein